MIRLEPVSSLLLDEANPRFEEAAQGQDGAITALLLDAPSKLVNLARDIAEQNSVNPTELPVAVEESDELIIIEGNRRVAALKLLASPTLAQDASEQLGLDLVKRFKDLSLLGSGPDHLRVYVAVSRENAKHWIDLRHTGENDGVGVLEWASWQANNFRRRRGTQADRAIIFCAAIENEFPAETKLIEYITKVRKERLTTLGRLIADPDIRRDFAFDFEDDKVVYYFSREDLLPGLHRIFEDLAGDITVTNIKTKSLRSQYIVERSAVLPDRSRRLSRIRKSDDDPGLPDEDHPQSSFALPEVETHKNTKSGGNSLLAKQSTQKEETVIFQGLRLNHVNPRISALLKRAQTINIDDAPEIAAILIRIILELVVTEAIERSAVPGKENDTLRAKIRNTLLAMDANCDNPVKRDKSLTMPWTRTQEPDGMAVQSLHAFVHNIYGDPTPSEVRTLSRSFREVLRRTDNLIAEVSK